MDLAQQRADAERALRRGDLKAAVAAYGAMVKAQPGDGALVQRFLAIREMIQQGELTSAKAAPPREVGEAGLASQAEAAAGRGELAQALALYRRAAAEQPGNELFLERMGELLAQLRQQAPPAPRSTAAPAAALPAPAPPPSAAPVGRPPAVAPAAPPPVARRAAPEAPPLPADPVACLTELLARITRNRRRTP